MGEWWPPLGCLRTRHKTGQATLRNKASPHCSRSGTSLHTSVPSLPLSKGTSLSGPSLPQKCLHMEFGGIPAPSLDSCSHTPGPSWRSLKRASAWCSPATGWVPAARCSSCQAAGQGCEAPTGRCLRWALGEVKMDLFPAVPTLGVRCHGRPSCHCVHAFPSFTG